VQPSIFPSFQSRPSPKDAIPYSSAAPRQDLERLRGVWDDCQASRDRNAIYGYLSAVYDLVAWWTAEGRDLDRARRALRLQRLEVLIEKTRSPRSSVAPPTRPRPTGEPGASGRGSCSTRQRTSRTRSRWSSSSNARAGSTPALLASLGVWGEGLRPEPRDERLGLPAVSVLATIRA
jgi:hypothetical protein